MKGLLLKDFYTIWKGGRIFLILYIFMAAVSGVNIQNGWSYMGFWLVMMDSQTSSTFSYDHSCNWNRFALTMPVTRKDVVRSKFLLQLLIVCGRHGVSAGALSVWCCGRLKSRHSAICCLLHGSCWVVLLMGSVSTLLLFRFRRNMHG
ncbi:MAG: ABC-2 transporter permease [Ruminococcus callidus]